MKVGDRQLLLWMAAILATTPLLAAEDDKPKAEQDQPLVTISKETTVLTEPLDEDGYVDFLAALNKKHSQGVTADNNAMVPLARSIGPERLFGGEDLADFQKAYFEKLGVEIPQVGDHTYVSIEQYAAKHEGLDAEALADEYDKLRMNPWKGEDHPQIAKWLDENRKSLELTVEASLRPKLYSPLVAGDDARPQMIWLLLPAPMEIGTQARLLACRAMLHAGEGRTDKALDDLLALKRLGRLVGSGPTLIEALVGISIEAIADNGVAAVARSHSISAKQFADFRQRLAKLPERASIVEKIDTSERYMFVDAVCSIARGEVDTGQLAGGGANDPIKAVMGKAGLKAIDWNVTLRYGNQWYDRMVDAGREKDPAESRRKFDELEEDMQKIGESLKSPLGAAETALHMLLAPRKTMGRKMGEVLSALLLPALQAAVHAEERAGMSSEMAVVELALSAYKQANGQYPKGLADLKPKYIDEIPRDIFTVDENIRYKLTDGGYKLYAVGRNGEDDGGRSYSDEQPRDDFVLGEQ